MITDPLNSYGAISNGELAHLISLATLLGVGIACVLFPLAWSTQSRKQGRKGTSHTGLYFILTFLLGFATYCVGMLPYNHASALAQFLGMMGVAPMALVHAVGMFLLQSDVSEINNACHNSWWFMVLFSFTHAAAACISTTVLIHHFGFSLMTKLRLYLTARVGKDTEELFVFWGVNEASMMLSKEVARKETKSHRIVFVYGGPDKKEGDIDMQQGQLLGFLHVPSDVLLHFKELQCLIAQPAPLMRDLDRIIGKTTGTAHFFVLGEDEASNLRILDHLRHNGLLQERAEKGLSVRCYARAESSLISQAVNDSHPNPHIQIRLIDASECSIQYLKSQPQYHPVRYVDIDTQKNPGTVCSTYQSMIIGFGYMGQEALRFLYEFSALVDSRSTVDEDFGGRTAKGEKARVRRAPCEFHLVDPDLKRKADTFFADYPGMRRNDEEVRMELHDVSTESQHFVGLVQEHALTLNQMVIATGKDDLNLDIAIRVFSQIRRVRRDMSRLHIFVLCTSAERARHFRTVIDHYNQDATDTLVLFGTNEMIYTYEHIIHNEFELQGRLYNESYCRVNRSPANFWKTRREKLVKRGTLDALASLRRKEWEDGQDAYHAATKGYLYEQACPKVRSTGELVRLICGDGDECNFRRQVPYPTSEEVTPPQVDTPICVMTHDTESARRALSDGEDVFLRNLARTEHLRWNASHEALGYIPLREYIRLNGDDFGNDPYETRHTCDERRKCHNCLVEWEELDQESLDTWKEIVDTDAYRWNPDYKLADFGVVANSIYHYTQKTAPHGRD
jgi:hypothetical protein